MLQREGIGARWGRSVILTVKNAPVLQSHRMSGVGRDLCGSSSATPLPKQGHLQQAAQDLVQAGLEYLQRRRIHNLSGQPIPVLHHPLSEQVLPQNFTGETSKYVKDAISLHHCCFFLYAF